MMYLDKIEVGERFGLRDWQRVMFEEFEATLLSESRPFPCIFGVTGLKQNQLRFLFCEELTPEAVAETLEHFVKHSRKYGPNTSLVVFSRPRPVMSLESYERHFWEFLRGLANLDSEKWPENIPMNMHDSMWEFSFAGEPIFVVCNTPAHVQRQSRRSPSFMVTFQPRWVFDKILGTEKSSKAAIKAVRERLIPYDISPPSPHLGAYGDPNALEFKQYFLREDDGPTACPYTAMGKKDTDGSEVA